MFKEDCDSCKWAAQMKKCKDCSLHFDDIFNPSFKKLSSKWECRGKDKDRYERNEQERLENKGW